VYGIIWEPAIEFLLGGLSGENFKPSDLARSAISFLHCSVKNAFTGSPNVRAGAITPNKWDYWIVRALNFSVLDGNLATGWGLNVLIRHKAALVIEKMKREVFVIQEPRESKWKGVRSTRSTRSTRSSRRRFGELLELLGLLELLAL